MSENIPILMVCPKCGMVESNLAEVEYCNKCNTKYIDTKYTYIQWAEPWFDGRIPELRVFMKALHEEYVYPSSEFDQEVFDRENNKREISYDKVFQNEERLRKEAEAKNAPVQCPKCGSTQIQLVNRKWSLLTGIFTNKVDRVCVACKHKF